MKQMQSRHVVLDVETTGLSAARGDRVIEIGAVALEGREVVDEFHSLIDVDQRISRNAQRVHGISEEMLRGKPTPAEVFPAFHEFIKGSVLVAHNARFDLSFLRHEFGRLGFGLPNRSQCTLRLSRRLYPGLPNYRLETIARYLFGSLGEEIRLHRALIDAQLTARVWLAMAARI